MLALGSYLFIALNIFKEDKLAYVFDSSSNMSASMSTQLRIQLNSVLRSSQILFQDFLSNKRFTEMSQKVFDGENSIEAILVFKKKGQDSQFVKQGVLEKTPDLADNYWEHWSGMAPALMEQAIQKKRLVKNKPHDDRLLILEAVSNGESKDNYVFAIVYQASVIKEIFSATKSMQAFVVDSLGSVIFGPPELEGHLLSEQFPMNYLNAESKKISQGAETVKNKSGEELLTSYSKVGFSDLSVVTVVEQKKALSATQVLMRKSFIFFVIMISFTAIISLLASRTLTESLTKLFDATKKVSEGQFDFQVNIKSNDEIGTLANNFNLMAVEVSRLLSQTAEKARMENELQTAKTVQETLFPESKAKIGPLSISGFYEPASECGGDWWHYCQIGEQVFLWIGDATGHGAPAALMTSAAKSASSIIQRLDVTPAEALELLNRCIYDVSKGQIMMTFFLAAFDLRTSILTYTNASHEAPFLIRKSALSPTKKDLVSLNEVNSPRLGQARETKYGQTSIQLGPEDLVFFYTDGVQDIRDNENNPWGEREFIKTLVQSNKDFPDTNSVMNRFVSRFQDYRQGSNLIDDVTFFVVKNEAIKG